MGVGVYAVALALGGLCVLYGRRLWEALLNRRRIIKVLSTIPGPTAIPILGNTHQFKLDRVAFSYQLEEFCVKYGSSGIFRLWIGPEPMVLFTKGSTAEPLLKSSTLITKGYLGYAYLRKWLGDGLLLSTGNKWQRRRKMLTPAFHYGILQGFVDTQAEQAGTLAEKLKPMAESGEAFDLFPFVGRCALDIICDSAMGVTVNAQQEKESAYVKAVLRISELIFKRERMPWLWLAPVWKALGYAAMWDHDYHLLTSFTKNVTHTFIVIDERKAALESEAAAAGVSLAQLKTEGKKLAFLDMLILLQAQEGQLSDADIAEEVDVFMFEGHDTTSSGMSWTLFLLGHHPDVQERVQEELDGIFGEDRERPATMEELKEMRYLERVIKESLRLYPPVPLFARTVTEDFVSGGQTIPKGATAVVLPFLTHRDPEEFGDDVDAFDPDRFLPDRAAGRHPYAYVPFSAGPRNCIGQKFALLEEKAVLSRVLRQFSIASLESIEAVRPIPDVILRPIDKFLVRLHKRK